MIIIEGIVLGLGGGALYALMTYFLYRTVKAMDIDSETAVAKIFVNERSQTAFKVLAASNVGLVILFTAKAAINTMNMEVLAPIPIMLLPVPLAGLTFFYWTIYDVTKRQD